MSEKIEKPIDEQIKDMIDYDDEMFKSDGEGFLHLLTKLERNESYVRYVLYIAHSTLIKGLKVSIRDISRAIERDVGYIQKITDIFLDENLLIKIKSHRKNIFTLNMQEDSLRVFMQLFKKAKKINFNKTNQNKNGI